MVKGNSSYSVACDIGGTFTDFMLLDEKTGEITIEKVLTTPADPSEGVITGLRSLARRNSEYIKSTNKFVHATTLVVNAVIERKGAKTALLCTKGFRDMLELRRHTRVKSHDLWADPPQPLIPRYLCVPVTERIYSDGRILVQVDPEEVGKIVRFLHHEKVQSVAISFLHSYVNSTHEEMVEGLLREQAPDIAVTASSQVLPEYGEYERTATTVVNAYVKPISKLYLHQLENRLKAEGFQSKLLVTFSGGGLTSARLAAEFPVRMIESGPVAGAVAAKMYGQLAGVDDILSFDMGGTTAKISLITGGVVPMTSTLEVARSDRFQKGSGYPVAVPSLDLSEVGAGGGSIARISKLGLVEVGPESAGASPGPICYGFGGREPTVTDADLVLGYLNPHYFLGGEKQLDSEATSHGLKERLADPLKRELTQAAWIVHDVVNENMAAALKMHVVEMGGDPTRCTMVAFGGCGPVHAYNLARKVGIHRLLVPQRAGVMSAAGLLAAPPALDLTRTYRVPLKELDLSDIERSFKDIEMEVARFLRETDSVGKIEFTRFVDLRYIGQGYQVQVKLPDSGSTTLSQETLRSLFGQEYRAKYGYFYDDVPGELVKLRVSGSIPGHELKPQKLAPGKGLAREALKGQRLAYSCVRQGMVLHSVYDRYRLAPGMQLEGPAIIEERESTTLIDQGGRMGVDEYGTLNISIV